jgi:hypothetical protein
MSLSTFPSMEGDVLFIKKEIYNEEDFIFSNGYCL